MLVGDVISAISFAVPEVLIAFLFYWWYSKRRQPKADPDGLTDIGPEVRRHKRKAILFSTAIFVGLFALATNGVKSSVVTWKVGICVSTSGAKITGYSSCSGNHFAKVIAIVRAKRDCPPSSTQFVTEASNDSRPRWTVCLDSKF